MKYEEVYENLIQWFPGFYIDDEDRSLQYIVGSYFIRFLIDKYNDKDLDTLKRGFQFIENLHLSEDRKVRELATIGYLENMLNTQLSKSDQFLGLLGVESKKNWLQLNKFWNS